jgi:hypothetical protein
MNGNSKEQKNCVKVTRKRFGHPIKLFMNKIKFRFLIPPSADGGKLENGFCPGSATNFPRIKSFILDEMKWLWKTKERGLDECVPHTQSTHRLQIKMTKRLMITEMKLTIVPKWQKAFLETDKVTPYVHCRFT